MYLYYKYQKQELPPLINNKRRKKGNWVVQSNAGWMCCARELWQLFPPVDILGLILFNRATFIPVNLEGKYAEEAELWEERNKTSNNNNKNVTMRFCIAEQAWLSLSRIGTSLRCVSQMHSSVSAQSKCSSWICHAQIIWKSISFPSVVGQQGLRIKNTQQVGYALMSIRFFLHPVSLEANWEAWK